ncbi:MAG TPA: zinc-dependent metalloprotease [Balneolaceae bacterium]|nr:zinc-dependent metalloprotease [Balneolaceae bacterium]
MKQGIAIFAAILLFAGCAASQKATTNGASAKESPDKEFAKLIKDAEKYEGFFDLYQKDSNLYISVPKEMLDKKFLMNFELATGIGSSGLYGGTMLNIFEGLLVSLEKHEGKIFLIQHPTHYTAKDGTPEARAVELTFGESVVQTAEIEAFNEDSTRMLIDVYDWFVGDLSGISTRISFAVANNGRPGRVSFDQSRSHLQKVQSFPDNVNIQARLTFNNSELRAPRTVADGRYIPVSVFYTMVRLPEEPMEPRVADDRVGYFMTVHKDFTDDSDTFFNRYINRWRLECSEEVGPDGLCEPKEPITYYIGRTVPVEYRDAMMAGVEAWSEAFEAAGFKNAVQAKLLPEGVMAEDIRYATLRWNTSDQPGYGAIGPSVVDPRTGEILDADILFEASMLLNDKETFKEIVKPRTAIDEIFNVSQKELAMMGRGAEMKSFYTAINAQFDLAKSLLVANGEIDSEEVPEEYVNQVMKWVTMHEVGHTLGLRHNFRSSIDTPLDKLYNKDWAKKNGVFSSVMEYPTVNINPESKSKDGYYYNPGIGSYDKWAISFGYTPSDDEAKQIARLAAKDGHAYGTDEDARGSGAIDPYVNVYDLGAKPLEWGKKRADLLQDLIYQIPEIAFEDNARYYEATELFQSYLYQYARTLTPAIKFIGGQHQYRDHVGDPQGRPPFVPIPKEKQQEALDILIEYAFNPDAMALPQEVYQKLGADRWSHWGNSNTFAGRIDYPVHRTRVGIQSALLEELLDPVRLARIRDTELKFGAENTLTIPDLMGQLSYAIWNEVWTSPGSNIESSRRDLQRAYLSEMIELVIDTPERAPADARSVARHQLKELHKKISARLAPPTYSFNDYTRAHLEESRARIEAALQAELVID